MVVIFIMSVAHFEIVTMNFFIVIFVATRPLLDDTPLALVTKIFLLFIQTDLFTVYFYVVVVAINSSRLLDDVGFTQIPGNTAFISSDGAVLTLGPMQ